MDSLNEPYDQNVEMAEKNEQETSVNDTTGDESTTAEVAQPHPRDSMPAWKWRGVVVLIGFLSIMYGYDVSNTANIQAPVYEAFGHIEILPWVALAFSTGNFAVSPLVRKFTTMFDLNILMAVFTTLFFIGPAVSGSAKNIQTVIAGRVITGIGSCGTYQLLMCFTAIFARPLEVPRIQGFLGLGYAVGMITGPVIGGAFAENSHTTWRWAFYINLPIIGVLILAGIFIFPHYTMPSKRTLSDHFRSIDYVGALLHATSVVLLAIALTFSGPVWYWDSAGPITIWVVWGVILTMYIIQQRFSIFTTPEDRIFPCYLFNHREVSLLTIATGSASIAQGIGLYYLPLFFAFARGYGALAVAVRLLPYICVFIVASVLCGILLPLVRRYKLFWLLAGALVVISGALMTQVSVTTSEQHVMGYGAILGFGVGLIVAHGFTVANLFLPSEHRFDLAALTNMAQIGMINIGLTTAGCIFQNVGFSHLKSAIEKSGTTVQFDDKTLREALAGVDSPLWQSGDKELVTVAVRAVTEVLAQEFYIAVAGGVLCMLTAALMSWEKLDFSKNVVPTQEESGTGQVSESV